jgi:hypothetical protein
MKTNFAIALVATLRLATAVPIESAATSMLHHPDNNSKGWLLTVKDLVAREEKREEGIYTYYTVPSKDKGKREEGIYTYYTVPGKDKEKREEGIYTYYTVPGKDKEKREEGIYTYYTVPAKDEEKRSPQDFADDAAVKKA